MLTLDVVLDEGYDTKKQEIVVLRKFKLELEHSLASLSKWESHWHKPFLSSTEKTSEETLWYITNAMPVARDVPPEVFAHLKSKDFETINDYITAKMTATWFSESKSPVESREIITAEVIYYWMVSLDIPFECEHWHLNRLITLIRVINLKNAPAKRMGRREAMERQRTLNAQRKAMYGSSG